MKIQVFEQFHAGHHSNYIKTLLPELAELVRENLVKEVFLTLTDRHFSLLQLDDTFKESLEYIKVDPLLQKISSNPSINERRIISSSLIDSIERNQPNYLISTSADYESLFLAIRNRLNLKSIPTDLFSLGIFHYGYAGSASRFLDRVKQSIYSFAWNNANWSRLLMVNPVVYETLIHRNRSFQQRVGLLPDPIPSSIYFDKETARRILNLPREGRYLGFIGAMDTRKAIPELVAAWANAKLGSKDYLLLAGKLHPSYRKLIESEFTELIDKGKIILLDRYLSQTELIAGYCALDLVAILQYPRPNLSANLLKAIAARRPVIVDDYGYTGMLAKRFKVGHTCNVTDREALISTLKIALEESGNYTINQNTERLIQFHHPTNFVNTVLHNLKGLLPLDYKIELKTWEWVCDFDESDLEGGQKS